MKRLYTLLSTIILITLLCTTAYAQPSAFFDTKGFSFQGYARNPSGGALASQNIDIRFTIYPSGDEAGAVFTETHSSVQTDPFGVFGVMVGGISTTQFRNINFGKANYFMKVETKPSTGVTFAVISNSALLSTPYATFANNGNPPGTIITFAGPKANIPPGYLICDGAELNVTDYPNLASAIGINWGGNGSTTFKVPDLRGMFLRGYSDQSDDDPDKATRTARNGGPSGNAVGSFQGYEVQSHNHPASSADAGAHNHNYTDPSIGSFNIQPNTPAGDTRTKEYPLANGGTTTTAGTHSHAITVSSVGGPETRPKNVYVLYLIKY